jgi:hypothetical protein
MAFNITEFTSQLNKEGTARAEHFEMSFSGNILEKIGPYYNNISGRRHILDILKGLTFRVEATTLPQRAISPLQYQDYGAPYKIGGLANYVEIDSTIILSADMSERHFFMAWQDLITGNHRTNDNNAENRGNQFDIGYFDNYKCDSITITQFGNGDHNKVGYEIKLYDAFPLNVGPVTVSWASTEILKQNVTFTYRYFKEYLK